MDTDGLVELVRAVAEPSRSLQRDERDGCLKLAFALQDVLRRKWASIVCQHPNEPAMFTYMADGWGAMINKTIRRPIPGSHLVVTRAGRLRQEFLLQRGIGSISLPTGETSHVMLVQEPIGLGKGRKAGHHFTAACDCFDSMRMLGHKGACIHFVVLDDSKMWRPIPCTGSARQAYSKLLLRTLTH